jgi:histidinol-phosphate aminotransferase
MNINQFVRPNILKLKPYSCARDEYKGEAKAYLDANENPYNGPYNRYPDPLQLSLKEKIAKVKGTEVGNIFLGNGSDEPIDLVYRVFCEPEVDNVVAIDPTYGMYQVCADINDVEYRKIALESGFRLNAVKLLAACDSHTKLIFLCSPNNPTGNCLDKKEIEKIIMQFKGMVVLDEAYTDFAPGHSFLPRLSEFPNLILFHTFSKAWGLASVRLGMAFASTEVLGYFNKVKYPYNINILTQQFVSQQLDESHKKEQWVNALLAERESLIESLVNLSIVKEVFPTDANFLLIKVEDADKTYHHLVDKEIIVRNRNTVSLCEGCLRITVGTPDENRLLIEALKLL